MRVPSQQQLLEVWEGGLEQSPLDRTLALMGLACPEDAGQLTLGECDRRLLELHKLLFGSEITALAHCPQCSSALELNFNSGEMQVDAGTPHTELVVSDSGYEASFRLPTLRDLESLGTDASSSQFQTSLLRRCLLEAKRYGAAIMAEELPEGLVLAVSERMSEADPQAEINIQLECAECRHGWLEKFDVESFLWTKIQAWAGRTLNEVHCLAAAYGWSEQQILALSPVRRHMYLNLVAE